MMGKKVNGENLELRNNGSTKLTMTQRGQKEK